MDKALLDFEVSIDADCKLLTVGKPFAIEGKRADWLTSVLTHTHSHTQPLLWMSERTLQEPLQPDESDLAASSLFVSVQTKRFFFFLFLT